MLKFVWQLIRGNSEDRCPKEKRKKKKKRHTTKWWKNAQLLLTIEMREVIYVCQDILRDVSVFL